MPADDIDLLDRLDRENAYVFVAGPGLGEGIAVALPGAGWLLVDGCTTGLRGNARPLESIVTRWRSSPDEPVAAMVLTHPHEDHTGGFAELVDAFQPQHVGLLTSSPGSLDLLKEARAKLRVPASRIEQIRRGSVLAALIAIARWEEAHPGKLLELHDGIQIPVTPSPARVIARSPNSTVLGLLGPFRGDPNCLSIVLELIHGSSRIVLTSDLPRYHTGTTTPISTGWDLVMTSHQQLGDHVVLKIPHHGSVEAMHPTLMPAGKVERRTWSVTPYNRSRLPRVANGEGMPVLLGLQPSILLTAVPASKSVQAAEPHPGVVQLSQFASRVTLQPTGARFLDGAGVEVTPTNTYEPLDPIWCIAVSQHGDIVGRWRGSVALEVVP